MAAQTSSFDVTTGVDLQEVDNAVNQAQKEIAQRYDFKGSSASIDFKRADAQLVLVADSDFQMTALFDVLQTKLIKRGVSVKNLDIGEIKPAGEKSGCLWSIPSSMIAIFMPWPAFSRPPPQRSARALSVALRNCPSR